MAAGNATALRALVVTTLVSFLLIQGVAGEFECCFCDCYNACKLDPGRPKDKVACHWECFNDPRCSFSCKNPGHCGRHSSTGDDMGVAIASGLPAEAGHGEWHWSWRGRRCGRWQSGRGEWHWRGSHSLRAGGEAAWRMEASGGKT